MQSTFRKNLLWLHTWAGLTVGLAMLFLAVTGGVLVMRPNFEDTLNRNLVQAPACAAPLPLDQVAAIARASHPGPIETIELTPDGAHSAAVMFADRDYVFVDPCGGRVLGVQNQYGGFFGTFDYLHRFRWIGAGRQIAGTMNLVVVAIIVIGGIILWWPRSRSSVKGALTFNIRLPGIARTLNLHKVIGAWAAAFLLAMSFTALPLSFDWARNVMAFIVQSPVDNREAPPPPAHPETGKRLNLQQLWTLAQADVPDIDWVAVHLPKKKSPIVEFEILERGMPHKNAKSYLYLDDVTGKVLKLSHYTTGTSLGRKVYLYFLAIHSGLIGGIPYQLLLMLACFSVPVQAYSGFSPYIRKQLRKTARGGLPLKVVAKTVEADSITSFELAHPRGKVLPAFSAGSHIDLTIAPGLTRQYSLCNDPKETHRYLVAVLREDEGRGGSVRMHEEVEVGDVLQASGPRNHFPLAHAAEKTLLIAGGIGITPILCMAERLANIGAEFSLHYCVRSAGQAAFAERIRASGFASRAHFHISAEGGRLNVASLLRRQTPETHVYVCGPNRLIDEVVETARALGWAEDRIHREYFAAAHRDTSGDKPFELKIASTGLVIEVPKERSAVQALAAHGIDIPTSCGDGVCGTCLTRVLEGEVEHRDMLLSPEERARNDQFTPCCSRSAGRLLVLDL